jgi:hypothetical protein
MFRELTLRAEWRSREVLRVAHEHRYYFTRAVTLFVFMGHWWLLTRRCGLHSEARAIGVWGLLLGIAKDVLTLSTLLLPF